MTSFVQPPFWVSSRYASRLPHSSVAIVTEPASEPVTVAELKTHANMDAGTTTDDLDTHIGYLITAARMRVEKDLGGCHLVATVLDQWNDGAPSSRVLTLDRWPVQSVASIKSYDADDTETTLSSTEYLVDTSSRPCRIALNYDANWPTSLREYKSIAVRHTVGFTTVPQTYRLAIMFLVSLWLVNREAATPETLQEMPLAYRSLVGDGPVTLA